MMSVITGVICLSLPIVVAVNIYVIHHKSMPAKSFQESQKRRLRYSTILFLSWSASLSMLCNLLWRFMLPTPVCSSLGDCVPEGYPSTLDHIGFAVDISIIGLILALVLYLILIAFDRTQGNYEKTKRKTSELGR